jgi:RNA polymerase sigma factor (sigma-70 family)
MVPRDVADDIVAEAFTRVLGAIRAGGGPGVAFRGYLLAAVRNLAADWLRATRRIAVAGDLDIDDRGAGRSGPLAQLTSGPEAQAEADAEAHLVARAFDRLPVRWRAVLLQLEVEGKAPMTVAPMFGLSANGVSALAMRAREGLRQAYLQEHVGANIPRSCRAYTALLGAGARGRLSRRRRLAMHKHLQHCETCSDLFTELTELNGRLGSILLPAVLAGASAAMATGRRAVFTSAWHAGSWRLWRVHPVTAAVGAATQMAAAGSMVLAVSLAPTAGSPAQHVAARVAASPVALTTSGPVARGQRAGGRARPLGRAAPLSGATSLRRTAGTTCTGISGTANGTCSKAGSPAPAGAAASQGVTNAAGAPGNVLGATTKKLGTRVGATTKRLSTRVGSIISNLGTGVGGITSSLGTGVGGITSSLGTGVGGITSSPGSVVGKTLSGIGNIAGNGTSKPRTMLGNVIPAPRSSGPFPG